MPNEPVIDTSLDYGSDADPDQAAVAEAFAQLDALALEAERAVAARKLAEEALQVAKDRETDLLNRTIPELLGRMRMDACTTSSGLKVAVKRTIRASIPADADVRVQAFAWLIANGHGGIIKNTVRIDLDRGEDDRATALTDSLRAQGFDPDAKRDVHAGTLSALVRELLEDGKVIPQNLLGVFDQRVSTVVRK